MPQLSFSVAPETVERLRADAAAQGCSVSKILATIVERHYGSGWPHGYLEGIKARAKVLEADFEFDAPPPFADRAAPDLTDIDE